MSYDSETTVSYLPLSHVAAQLFDIFIPVVCGVTIYFAQPDALKVCLHHYGMVDLMFYVAF